MEFIHEPVLLGECIENLGIRPDGVYVDGTLGGAGHAREILKRLGTNGRLIGIDQDQDAVAAAMGRLGEADGRVRVIRDNYRNIKEILKSCGVDKADGILLDLGISSYQIDNPERGFSYKAEDAPLDMRMDRSKTRTAADIVAEASAGELTAILRDFGEERFAARIAEVIVRERESEPVRTAGQLAAIVRKCIPRRLWDGGPPERRTFQALRIALNEELTVLSDTLPVMIDLLSDRGRLAVITFHSLEDRIVKNVMRSSEHPCVCPPDFPVCRCGRKPKGRVVTRKPILPREEETERNPRAKSAKLRVFERVIEE